MTATKPTVSDEAKARAVELANAERVTSSSSWPFIPADCENSPSLRAFAAYIQQVSDAAKLASDQFAKHPASAPCIAARKHLEPFIQPEVVDPLAEAVEEVLAGFENKRHAKQYANAIRLKLAARGIELAHAGES